MGKVNNEPKPIDGKEIVEDLNKRKKEIKKEENKEMKKTILTVLITLATVAAFVIVFLYGMSFGASQERSLNDRVQTEAKSLSTATVEQLKK